MHRDWLFMFDEAVNETKAIMKERGREDEFLGAKVRLEVVVV